MNARAVILLPVATGCAVWLAACTAGKARQDPWTDFDPNGGKSGRNVRAASGGPTLSANTNAVPEDTPEPPPVRSVATATAQVRQVNPRLQFIVLDFGLETIPAPTTPMTVFRGTDPIAFVRVGRLVRGTTVVADILEGEVLPGDVARMEVVAELRPPGGPQDLPPDAPPAPAPEAPPRIPPPPPRPDR